MSRTSTRKHRVAIVLGTRPEAIKMAPVIGELRRRNASFETVVITTSQQREMLAQAMHACRLTSDIDLGLTHENQTLANFTARALIRLTEEFRRVQPDLLLVQGDTSTVIAAALAAFYNGIPIGHVEAGLRSGDSRRPFPDRLVALRGGAGTEGYQLTGIAATLRRFRSQEAGVSWREWIGARFGLVLGGELYHNPFYPRAGVSLGVFRGW